MKCKCGFKKDLDKGKKLPLKCPKCGAEVGAGFDIYEVPIEEKDSSGRNWTPWIIGGGIILVLLVVIIFLLSRKRRKKSSKINI